MRVRTQLICVAVAVGGLLATTGSAQAAAPKFSYDQTSLSAAGWFTDLPDQPVPGTEYHDSFINAGVSATKDDGTKSNGSWAYVQTTTYSFDENLDWVFVGQTTGYVDGAAVSFAADKKLTTAAVTATVPLTTCDEAGNCVDSGPETFSATWSGAGDLTKSDGRGTEHDGCTTTTYRFKGTQRQGTATSNAFGSTTQALLSDGSFTQKSMWSHC